MQHNIMNLQTVSGFHRNNHDPYGTSYKRLARAMLSCFVNDIQSYQRLKKRKDRRKKLTTTMRWHHDQIRGAYASAMSWAQDRSDYLLSIKSCAEEVGIDVDDFLKHASTKFGD